VQYSYVFFIDDELPSLRVREIAGLEQYRFKLHRVAINISMKLLDKVRLEWVGVSRSRSSSLSDWGTQFPSKPLKSADDDLHSVQP